MTFLTQPTFPHTSAVCLKDSTHSRQMERNEDRVLQLEQAMFNRRSRYLILVLTLNYHVACRNDMTIEDLQQHRNQLLNNRRNNALLAGIEGYVWKIEEGKNAGGLHLHLILFYSGCHRADVQIAESIGEYWKNVITGGYGTYWNSNARKDMHARYGYGIGTGQIDRNNHEKREALRITLRYLAKDDQRISYKIRQNDRMFGTSQF